MSKFLLVDVDGVLLDFYNHFSQHVIDLGWRTYKKPNHMQCNEHLDLPENECASIIKEWAQTDRYAKIPAFEDALIGLMRFQDAGYEIVAITCWPNDTKSIEIRLSNLKWAFPFINFHAVHCLGYQSDKLPYLQMYPTRSIWVDDGVKNACQGLEVGHKSYLMVRGQKPQRVSNPDLLLVPNFNIIVENELEYYPASQTTIA